MVTAKFNTGAQGNTVHQTSLWPDFGSLVPQTHTPTHPHPHPQTHLEHWRLLLADEQADVGVAQVGAVDLLVAAAGVDVREGLVHLQRPHALVVHAVRGDTPLLAQRPQADGAVRAARQTLVEAEEVGAGGGRRRRRRWEEVRDLHCE